MGLYGNLYLSASQSLAIVNEPLYFFEGIIQSENDTAALIFLGTDEALNASQASCLFLLFFLFAAITFSLLRRYHLRPYSRWYSALFTGSLIGICWSRHWFDQLF